MADIFWCNKCRVRCDGLLIGGVGMVHMATPADKHFMDDGRSFEAWYREQYGAKARPAADAPVP